MHNNSKPLSSFTAALTMCEHCDWQIPPRHLHRLLYFANLFYMGRNDGRPLIEDSFHAWEFCPVIPVLEKKIGYFGSRPVRDVFWHEEIVTEEPERGYIDAVAAGFKQGGPTALLALLLLPQSGWLVTYYKDCSRIIQPKVIMAEYNAYYRKNDQISHRKPLRLARDKS